MICPPQQKRPDRDSPQAPYLTSKNGTGYELVWLLACQTRIGREPKGTELWFTVLRRNLWNEISRSSFPWSSWSSFQQDELLGCPNQYYNLMQSHRCFDWMISSLATTKFSALYCMWRWIGEDSYWATPEYYSRWRIRRVLLLWQWLLLYLSIQVW